MKSDDFPHGIFSSMSLYCTLYGFYMALVFVQNSFWINVSIQHSIKDIRQWLIWGIVESQFTFIVAFSIISAGGAHLPLRSRGLLWGLIIPVCLLVKHSDAMVVKTGIFYSVGKLPSTTEKWHKHPFKLAKWFHFWSTLIFPFTRRAHGLLNL